MTSRLQLRMIHIYCVLTVCLVLTCDTPLKSLCLACLTDLFDQLERLNG